MARRMSGSLADLVVDLAFLWDLFQFTTYVDGEPWFYSRHLLGVGRTWTSGYMGRGRALIYASCGSYDHRGLSEGTHIVEIKATLPGSDREWVSEPLEIELDCEGVELFEEKNGSLADLNWLIALVFGPLLLLFGVGTWLGARWLWNLWKGNRN